MIFSARPVRKFAQRSNRRAMKVFIENFHPVHGDGDPVFGGLQFSFSGATKIDRGPVILSGDFPIPNGFQRSEGHRRNALANTR